VIVDRDADGQQTLYRELSGRYGGTTGSWSAVKPLAAQAIVFLGFGVALTAAPAHAAPLWPWKLTPLLAVATGAWLISLGVAAGQALLARDARRLRPAAVGYLVLAVLQSIALARYPNQFRWHTTGGVIYLIFLAAVLLTGAVGLARGRPRTGRQSAPGEALRAQPK
jgi:hypothetical protein